MQATATLTNRPFACLDTNGTATQTIDTGVETASWGSTTAPPEFRQPQTVVNFATIHDHIVPVSEDLSGLNYLFPDLDLELSTTSSPTTQALSSPPAPQSSHRSSSSPTSTPSPNSPIRPSTLPISLRHSRCRSPSFDRPCDISNDEDALHNTPPILTVPIKEGSGLAHVFLSRDQHELIVPVTPALNNVNLLHSSSTGFGETGSSQTLLNTREQSPLSPSLGQAEKKGKFRDASTNGPFDNHSQTVGDEEWILKVQRIKQDHHNEVKSLWEELAVVKMKLAESEGLLPPYEDDLTQRLANLERQESGFLCEEVKALKEQLIESKPRPSTHDGEDGGQETDVEDENGTGGGD